MIPSSVSILKIRQKELVKTYLTLLEIRMLCLNLKNEKVPMGICNLSRKKQKAIKKIKNRL